MGITTLSGNEASPAAAYGTGAPPFAAFVVEATTNVAHLPVQRGMVVSDCTAGGSLDGEIVPGGTRWHLHWRCARTYRWCAHREGVP